MKTQLQLQGKSLSGQSPKFSGMISGFQYVIREHGFLALYKGLTPTLVASVPKAGIRFGLNSYIAQLLKDENGKLTAGRGFVAGLLAGTTEAALVTAPAETVKTKLIQANMGMISGARYIVLTEGVAGMYQGVTATILKQGSNHGLRFMWFGQYKQYLLGEQKRNLTALESFFGGMSAGLFSTLGNNPFDVVKTRMQGLQASNYRNTLDCFVKMSNQEGFASFYKGMIPRLGRVLPGQGIIFMSFESIQTAVEKFLRKK